MTVSELLDEYNLSADDVRWSLSLRMAESLAITLEEGGIEAVTRRIWSGEVADELYDSVERWMKNADDLLSRAILDEGHLRDELSQMVVDGFNRRPG